MQKDHVKHVLVSVCFFACTGVSAEPQDLIQRLYYSDFSEEEEQPAKPFTMDGELGLIVSTGNTAASSIKAAINADHNMDDWNNTYNAELLYTESDTDGSERAVTAQRFYSTAQFDYKLHANDRRLFLYADYEDDRFNGYKYRSTLAAGWSHRAWKGLETEFRYSIGPGYTLIESEEPTLNSVNSGAVLRASAEYRYNWSTGARFRQFVSTEAGTSNIRSRSETSVSASIFGSLAMKLSLILIHETNPAPTSSTLSSETSVSLVYHYF
ncbi:DUF481 domain-containing protein [Alteromonas sp. CYL-A6]|uniref:DUF481 domain-containing protein n=1 Tax=Alteromonas nitratireducens TaxID=3390813 RepID=UPI0034C10824